MIFERYDGSEEEVLVAFDKQGKPFGAIGAKAFLSCKTIKKLEIAGSVTEIGDWAFAHMQNLEMLVLPCRELKIGKKAFLDCEKLMKIQIMGDESNNPGTSWLMASAVRTLKKYNLCKPDVAGRKETHKEWIKAYDKELLSFLEESDEEGFEPVFIGWFHVENIDEQIPRYLEKRRREKAELVLQRLLYADYMQEETLNSLYDYVKEHIPEKGGRKEHISVYELFCEMDSEYGKDIRYLKILEKSGCLNQYVMEKLLADIKEPSAEVMAYLLKRIAGEKKENDFFDEFML